MPAMPQLANLSVRSVNARAVNVPLACPHPTSSGTVSSAPLVLLDLLTEEGVTGCSYVFCYTTLALKPVAELVTNMATLVKGDALAPVAIEQKLQKRFRLLGPQGLTGIAMAGIDMAAWDALAKASGQPLARLLGHELRPMPAYCGLGMTTPQQASQEAQELLETSGFRGVKAKIGFPDVKSDVAVIRAVRSAVGELPLMVDYNQCLSVTEAITRIRVLDDEGLHWIEEPTLAHDFVGHARIAQEAATPIQMGENWWGPHDMLKSLAAHASDYVMPDVMKIGGVTGWLRAAALAETHGMALSSHIFPEVSSHLLAATPTAHWLEYQDWANPILLEPLQIKEGFATPSSSAGCGIAWDEAVVQRYLVK